MVDSQPDACRFAEGVGQILSRAGNPEEQGHRQINIFGEMVALLWADGKFDAAIRLELLWNELAKKYDFSCLRLSDQFLRSPRACTVVSEDLRGSLGRDSG